MISSPRITTDGTQVFGTVCIDEDHTQLFKVGLNDSAGWWGYASARNALCYDLAGFGGKLHWLWVKTELGNADPCEGELYYTSRQGTASDDCIVKMLKLAPVRSKRRREANSSRTKSPSSAGGFNGKSNNNAISPAHSFAPWARRNLIV